MSTPYCLRGIVVCDGSQCSESRFVVFCGCAEAERVLHEKGCSTKGIVPSEGLHDETECGTSGIAARGRGLRSPIRMTVHRRRSLERGLRSSIREEPRWTRVREGATLDTAQDLINAKHEPAQETSQRIRDCAGEYLGEAQRASKRQISTRCLAGSGVWSPCPLEIRHE